MEEAEGDTGWTGAVEVLYQTLTFQLYTILDLSFILMVTVEKRNSS